MNNQAWIMLVAAGLLEIGWEIGLKYADGFTRLVPSVLTIAAMIASMLLLAQAARSLPIGIRGLGLARRAPRSSA